MQESITSIEVFRKIKAMSRKTLNPNRRILLTDMMNEIPVPQNSLLVLLIELEDRGLIKIHKTTIVSVSLTNYGIDQENPPGRFSSQ